MSAEELKIRGELELDVERELEAELKDEIYRLGLRLHRLYQLQKERELARELSEPGIKNQHGIKNKALSEVNINIRMEGGTKIEIKETKKQAGENDHTPRSSNSRSRLEENMLRSSNSRSEGRKLVAPSSKKFDWAKTLRSGPGNVDFHKVKALKSGRLWDDNVQIDGVRKNCASALGQRKGEKANGTQVMNLI